MAQKDAELERILVEEFNKESLTDGGWVFNPENSQIQKINNPTLSRFLDGAELYHLTMTNYLGYHVNDAMCVILYWRQSNKIQLIEPLWYGGVSIDLLRNLIGRQFNSTEELIDIINHIHDLMEIGSVYEFEIVDTSEFYLEYNLGYKKGVSYSTENTSLYYHDLGVWRKIRVELDELKIERYISTNPKTDESVIIR